MVTEPGRAGQDFTTNGALKETVAGQRIDGYDTGSPTGTAASCRPPGPLSQRKRRHRIQFGAAGPGRPCGGYEFTFPH
jgi:hypothetical protein